MSNKLKSDTKNGDEDCINICDPVVDNAKLEESVRLLRVHSHGETRLQKALNDNEGKMELQRPQPDDGIVCSNSDLDKLISIKRQSKRGFSMVSVKNPHQRRPTVLKRFMSQDMGIGANLELFEKPSSPRIKAFPEVKRKTGVSSRPQLQRRVSLAEVSWDSEKEVVIDSSLIGSVIESYLKEKSEGEKQVSKAKEQKSSLQRTSSANDPTPFTKFYPSKLPSYLKEKRPSRLNSSSKKKRTQSVDVSDSLSKSNLELNTDNTTKPERPKRLSLKPVFLTNSPSVKKTSITVTTLEENSCHDSEKPQMEKT